MTYTIFAVYQGLTWLDTLGQGAIKNIFLAELQQQKK